ncbi:MAG: diacylglycerol kinase family protein [Cyanobacteria bacterium P01_B01_bin.77]
MSISSNLQTAPKSKKESKTAWQVAPDLFTSFRYAWAGIVYAVRTQRNFRIHLAIGLVALSLGIMLHIQALEAAVVAITVSAVLVIELINTALESVVDLTVGQTYHELAKIAKDCAAGAVLIAAMAALLVAAFIYLPPLFVLFKTGIS